MFAHSQQTTSQNTHTLARQIHHLHDNYAHQSAASILNRHLLSVETPHHQLQAIHADSQYGDYILGMSPGAFWMLNIFLAFVITVAIIAWVCYRRYRTRLDYNQNPQLFPHVPELSSKQENYLNRTELKVLLGKPTIKKDDANIQGTNYTLTFEGEKSGVYFDLIQKNECYFQIEVIELNGPVEIGYLQKDALQNVMDEAETLGSVGVSLNTNGFVVALGENVYNYSWTLQYGDVIGIALTKESDKFNERRAWITKNGILLNSPPSNQLGKWLATVQITAQEREEYNMGSQNPANDKADVKANGKELNQEQLQMKAAAEKAAQEREQNLLEKQRISLKTYKNFEFYPTIVFSGLKNETKGKKSQKKTVINLNVGGQIFRMQQTFFRSGLLKPQ